MGRHSRSTDIPWMIIAVLLVGLFMITSTGTTTREKTVSAHSSVTSHSTQGRSLQPRIHLPDTHVAWEVRVQKVRPVQWVQGRAAHQARKVTVHGKRHVQLHAHARKHHTHRRATYHSRNRGQHYKSQHQHQRNQHHRHYHRSHHHRS